jgi:hypothetical protein
VFFFFVVCGGEVTLKPGQDGCTDYDFDNPAESEVDFEVAGGSGRVFRTYALLEQTGLLFDPVIDVGGNTVSVYERWTGGESDDAFCYAPYVAFEGLEGKLTVDWFLADGDTVPYDSVEIEAE